MPHFLNHLPAVWVFQGLAYVKPALGPSQCGRYGPYASVLPSCWFAQPWLCLLMSECPTPQPCGMQGLNAVAVSCVSPWLAQEGTGSFSLLKGMRLFGGMEKRIDLGRW